MASSLGISDATKKTFDELKEKAERRISFSGVPVSLTADEFLNVLLIAYRSSMIQAEAAAK
jgi:hypothetical protein